MAKALSNCRQSTVYPTLLLSIYMTLCTRNFFAWFLNSDIFTASP